MRVTWSQRRKRFTLSIIRMECPKHTFHLLNYKCFKNRTPPMLYSQTIFYWVPKMIVRSFGEHKECESTRPRYSFRVFRSVRRPLKSPAGTPSTDLPHWKPRRRKALRKGNRVTPDFKVSVWEGTETTDGLFLKQEVLLWDVVPLVCASKRPVKTKESCK